LFFTSLPCHPKWLILLLREARSQEQSGSFRLCGKEKEP
jgi:hypothetical protein